jgi:Fic family protein
MQHFSPQGTADLTNRSGTIPHRRNASGFGRNGQRKSALRSRKARIGKNGNGQVSGLVQQRKPLDPVLKAAIAHFWFIIIHPFDDGNGRIGRAITDMLLARAEGSGERFYSMSSQILAERKRYYEVLQKVQHSSGDITEWLDWFLHCLKNAMLATENTTQKILRKAEFWKLHEHTPINERQRLMLNKLFDDFEGKLQTSKWAKIAKTSTDTALRDIKDLVEKGILQQTKGGRNANYELVDFKYELVAGSS